MFGEGVIQPRGKESKKAHPNIGEEPKAMESTPMEEGWGNEPKRHKAYKTTYPVKVRYVTHHARSDVGKRITKLMDKIAGEGDFISTIGWTTEDIAEGDEEEPGRDQEDLRDLRRGPPVPATAVAAGRRFRAHQGR